MDDSIVKKFLELRDGLYLIADLDGYRIGINRQRGKGMCLRIMMNARERHILRYDDAGKLLLDTTEMVVPAGTPLKVVKDQENLRGLLQERIIAPLSERSDNIPVRYFRDAVTGIYLLAAREEIEDEELCAELLAFNITAAELRQEESVTTLVEQLLAARPGLCDAERLAGYISRVELKKKNRTE